VSADRLDDVSKRRLRESDGDSKISMLRLASNEPGFLKTTTSDGVFPSDQVMQAKINMEGLGFL
jgi:hypothetical protein